MSLFATKNDSASINPNSLDKLKAVPGNQRLQFADKEEFVAVKGRKYNPYQDEDISDYRQDNSDCCILI